MTFFCRLRSATLVDTLAGRADSSSLDPLRGGAVRHGADAAAAQISVPLPFTQVPFTFQPMVVLLGGLALGSRLGLASQVLYLLAGIAGFRCLPRPRRCRPARCGCWARPAAT